MKYWRGCFIPLVKLPTKAKWDHRVYRARHCQKRWRSAPATAQGMAKPLSGKPWSVLIIIFGRINPKWDSEGGWDNRWYLQGLTKGAWVVQHELKWGHCFLWMQQKEERYVNARKSLVDRMTVSYHGIPLYCKWGGLWALEQLDSARACIGTAGPGSHCGTHRQKGLHVKLWKGSLAAVIISSPLCCQHTINFFH